MNRLPVIGDVISYGILQEMLVVDVEPPTRDDGPSVYMIRDTDTDKVNPLTHAEHNFMYTKAIFHHQLKVKKETSIIYKLK